LPFEGTGVEVASLICKVPGTIVGVLEAEGLTNLTFGVLGGVTSSEWEVIITLTTEMSMGIVSKKICLVGRT